MREGELENSSGEGRGRRGDGKEESALERHRSVDSHHTRDGTDGESHTSGKGLSRSRVAGDEGLRGRRKGRESGCVVSRRDLRRT
jgi:hypothetical protein